jgi:replicative DNA helicase
MSATLERLESLGDAETRKPFAPYEEEAIVSLALDNPEFFTAAARFMKPDMFGKIETKFIVANILSDFEKYGVVPTRQLLRSRLEQELTEDDPYDEIFRIIDRKSNPREVPLVKDSLLKWSRNKAYGLLYSDEAMEAYQRNDFAFLEQIVQEANRIADVGNQGLWFFDSLELLFQPDAIEHRTTGFPRLDMKLNNGGPSPKEVVCWMAPTNVGKSILLCQNAIASIKGEGPGGRLGQDVLLITFELDTVKTAMRCLASASGIPINDIPNHKEYIRRTMNEMKDRYGRRFLIHEMPPEECSVNHIYALLDSLKRLHNWKPDVVIIDYMDLMVSRNPAYNKDDYGRQKHVAGEIRGLAKNENVLVFTATQTNRDGAKGDELIDLTKAAESFGKSFALDYVITLNQTTQDRTMNPPRIHLYIAKNRNGPKNEVVHCEINYNTMVVKEAL